MSLTNHVNMICRILILYAVFKVRMQLFFYAADLGLSGLEPPTSRLSGVRSNLLSYKPLSENRMIFNLSGDGEIRTHDPLLARQVLSQLSYTPNL